MKLPGGACVRARVGVHSGEASDSLVGCSNTLHYRCNAHHVLFVYAMPLFKASYGALFEHLLATYTGVV